MNAYFDEFPIFSFCMKNTKNSVFNIGREIP